MSEQRFEESMRAGVEHHARGEYDAALTARLGAMHAADNEVDRARAERDVAAAYGRLGQTREAIRYAYQSWGHLESSEDPRAERERAASAMQIGQIFVSSAIREELAGSSDVIKEEHALDWLQRAYETVLTTESSKPDQYRVTMLRRISTAEGLYGSRSRGIKLGVLAVALGALAESPIFINNIDSSMNLRRRMKVRARAVAGGSAALVSSLLATRDRDTRRRRVALKAARIAA